MPSIFRDPVVLTFVDAADRELLRVVGPTFVPRVGENVRLGGRPHVVERVGYDFPEAALETVWVVCRAV